MTVDPLAPPLGGLRRSLARTRSRKGAAPRPADPFVRETFALPRGEARAKARAWLELYPPAAYWSGVESWRELAGDRIEFTMRRLPTAD